jgi:glutamate racemase
VFDDRPIGIFDSGLGGLTVAAALNRQLPDESLCYLGDTARVPYGNKSAHVVKSYTHHCARFLQNKDVKLIVVACNTASAYGLEHLRQTFNVPVVGVVHAGAELAIQTSSTKKIGVIGTRATVQSQRYAEILRELDQTSQCKAIACPLLVPLAEEGMVDHPMTEALLREYLNDFSDYPMDTLILGCTHYPLFEKTITKLVGKDVQVINSAPAVAQSVMANLSERHLMCPDKSGQKHEFYVTDSAEEFARVGERFWGQPLENITHVDLQIS